MVPIFPLNCLGHNIKYWNPEAGNTTQEFLSTTRPNCSVEFIESFLFCVIIVTYNLRIQIYVASYTHSFFVIFNSNGFFALHAKEFEIWIFFFVKMMNRLLHSTIHQLVWYFRVFKVNPLSLLWSIFSSRNCVSFGLLFFCSSQLGHFW